jgi:hypothetical protein
MWWWVVARSTKGRKNHNPSNQYYLGIDCKILFVNLFYNICFFILESRGNHFPRTKLLVIYFISHYNPRKLDS